MWASAYWNASVDRKILSLFFSLVIGISLWSSWPFKGNQYLYSRMWSLQQTVIAWTTLFECMCECVCLEFVVLKFVGKFFCTYVLLNYHRFVVFVLTNTQMHLGSDWEHFLKTNQLQWRIMLSRVTWKISSSKQSKCWLHLYILWEKQ